jgi:hypothetical protein
LHSFHRIQVARVKPSHRLHARTHTLLYVIASRTGSRSTTGRSCKFHAHAMARHAHAAPSVCLPWRCRSLTHGLSLLPPPRTPHLYPLMGMDRGTLRTAPAGTVWPRTPRRPSPASAQATP